tara:strand:- start:5172 stop:7088 length:1917 start_codon:yes stop_codon:yes gene_type:complete
MLKVIHKPWGKEEWIELNDSYCYKRIYIKAGYKTSYQYHKYKKETNYIISGKAEIWLENDKGVVERKIMNKGDYFNVKPPKKHRVIALTDLILQEVSTPEVDDVFRINDEYNREDGKIEAEHKTPAVLILSAGLGSRLGNLTKYINKAMLPINNEAIISLIIKKFPRSYDFVITLGYKGNQLKEFLEHSFPTHNFIFVKVDNYDKKNTGPGSTAIKCKKHLQRPFYFVVSDCIVDSKIPHIDGNWLGVQETSFPEKYSTIKINDASKILDFSQKSKNGHENAFIGLASIRDYKVFWNELDKNMINGEIVNAFNNVSKYNNLKAKNFKWFDAGNLDDLNYAKKYFKDKPLSLSKNTGEITYLGESFLKYNPSKDKIKNISKRARYLSKIIPKNFVNSNYFIKYDWLEGKTLYQIDSLKTYSNFLIKFSDLIKKSEFKKINNNEIKEFYINKTKKRVDLFIKKNGINFLNSSFKVNGISTKPMKDYLERINVKKFDKTKKYNMFHGDLQFDNILFGSKEGKYYYIDWRESFAGDTSGGDLYYDLSKLYGGLIINYFMVKQNKSFEFEEGATIINYKIFTSEALKMFKNEYENWIVKEGYDLTLIKYITGLIFLNMSPLHDDNFGKLLWFKSIEMFNHENK